MTIHFPARLPAGALIDAYYKIDGHLGAGGFADVYSGVQLDTGKSVAIKILRPIEDEETHKTFQRRFLQEAQAAASIEHPNIVTMMARRDLMTLRMPAGGEGVFERCYIVMERLTGHDLQTELARSGAMSPRRAQRLMLGCLDGLALGHELGIVHKDLKPANLFLVNPGRRAEMLKILDFGIARVGQSQQEKITQTGQGVFTAKYAAPEYIKHQLALPALDVYQMGLILCEMLTGQSLVQGHTFQCIVAHSEGITLPSDVLDSPLGGVIAQATAHDHTQRFPNAEAFCAALEKIDAQKLAETVLRGQSPAITSRDTLEPIPQTEPAPAPDTTPANPPAKTGSTPPRPEPVLVAAFDPWPAAKKASRAAASKVPAAPERPSGVIERPEPPPRPTPETKGPAFSSALLVGLGGVVFLGLFALIALSTMIFSNSTGDEVTVKTLAKPRPTFTPSPDRVTAPGTNLGVRDLEQIELLLTKAGIASEKEEWVQALSFIDKALQKAPDHSLAHTRRTEVLRELRMEKFYKTGRDSVTKGEYEFARESFAKISKDSFYYKRLVEERLIERVADLEAKAKRDFLDAGGPIGDEARSAQMKKSLSEARVAAARGLTAECITKANEGKAYGAGTSADLTLAFCYEKEGKETMAIEHYNSWLSVNDKSKLAPKIRKKITALGGKPAN